MFIANNQPHQLTFSSVASFFSSFFFLTTLFLHPCHSSSKLPVIAITQIVSHPSADDTRYGILDGLKEAGYRDGETVKILYENPQGNMATAIQIAKKFAADEQIDIIVPITTPSAQTVVSEVQKQEDSKRKPVVFASVTDPLHAKIVSKLENQGGFVTGAMDAPALKEQIELIQESLPRIKKIGMVYNPGETNSAKLFKDAKKIMQDKGITCLSAVTTNSSGVPEAIRKILSQGIEALYIALDNTVLSAMDTVLKITLEHGIPTFSSDPNSVEQGVLASVSYTQYDAGRLAAQMIIRILKGEKPGHISVSAPPETKLHINTQTARKLNITLPSSVMQRADKVHP